MIVGLENPAMARLLSVGGDLPRNSAASLDDRSDYHRPDSDRGGRSTSGSARPGNSLQCTEFGSYWRSSGRAFSPAGSAEIDPEPT